MRFFPPPCVTSSLGTAFLPMSSLLHSDEQPDTPPFPLPVDGIEVTRELPLVSPELSRALIDERQHAAVRGAAVAALGAVPRARHARSAVVGFRREFRRRGDRAAHRARGGIRRRRHVDVVDPGAQSGAARASLVPVASARDGYHHAERIRLSHKSSVRSVSHPDLRLFVDAARRVLLRPPPWFARRADDDRACTCSSRPCWFRWCRAPGQRASASRST